MFDGGWLKLYRSLLKKPIWKLSTPEQKAILITLLCMVNHDDEEWEWKGKKYICKPGQTITSLDKIAAESGKGISIQNVRTALLRFEKLEFLTNESTNESRLITVLNWELYQSKNDNLTSEPTSDQQIGNKPLTPNKNDKNDKNDKELYISIVEYLNSQANTKYKPSSKKTRSLIDARTSEGFTLEDFKNVIDNKVATWKWTEWEQYLRPETLFGTKFEGYLNQKGGSSSGSAANNPKPSAPKYDTTKILARDTGDFDPDAPLDF